MQLKDIIWPRLAGMLYVGIWHIWKYACNVKIWLKGLQTHIIFSPCSRLVSYCIQLSSTQHPSLSPIQHGLQTDPITQSHITHLWVSPDSTTHILPWLQPDLGPSHRWWLPLLQGTDLCPQQSGCPTGYPLLHHNHCLAGHPGITKTIKNIWLQFYWPKWLPSSLNTFIHAQSCSCSKALHHKPFRPHWFLPISEQPWDSILMDFHQGAALVWWAWHDPGGNVLSDQGWHCSFLWYLSRYLGIFIFTKPLAPYLTSSADQGKHFISLLLEIVSAVARHQANLSLPTHLETWMVKLNRSTRSWNSIFGCSQLQQDDWVNLLPWLPVLHTTTFALCNQGHPLYEVHQNWVPRLFTDWKESVRSEGLVMEGLAATTDWAWMNVFSDEGNHLGPVELKPDVLDCLSDAGCPARQWLCMGSKGYPVGHPDCWGHRSVPCSKGSHHLVRVTKGQVKPMAGMVVVESGLTHRCVMWGLSDWVSLKAMLYGDKEGWLSRGQLNAVTYQPWTWTENYWVCSPFSHIFTLQAYFHMCQIPHIAFQPISAKIISLSCI